MSYLAVLPSPLARAEGEDKPGGEGGEGAPGHTEGPWVLACGVTFSESPEEKRQGDGEAGAHMACEGLRGEGVCRSLDGPRLRMEVSSTKATQH